MAFALLVIAGRGHGLLAGMLPEARGRIPHGQRVGGEVAQHGPPALVDEAGDPPHLDVVALVEDRARVLLGIVGVARGSANGSRCLLRRRFIDDHLPPWQEEKAFDAFHRALGGRLELAQRDDLVPVELDANRVLAPEGEDVDDAATACDVALLLDERHSLVTEIDEPVRELVGVERIADAEREHAPPHHLRSGDLGGERGGGGHDHRAPPRE